MHLATLVRSAWPDVRLWTLVSLCTVFLRPTLRCEAGASGRMGSTAGLLSAIVGGMSAHVANVDVQRAGLEALWYLAWHGTTQCVVHTA